MPGGLIRSGIVKRRAASAMSGVESSAKARDSDSASMPRSCSHSAGFAKGEAGAQSSEWKNETAKSEVSSNLFPMRSGTKVKKEELGIMEEPPSLITASQGGQPPAFDFSTCVGITLIDVGPTQQIVESPDPVPSVTIAFQHNAVLAGFVSPAVVLSKEINQQLAMCTIHARIQENFTRLFM